MGERLTGSAWGDGRVEDLTLATPAVVQEQGYIGGFGEAAFVDPENAGVNPATTRAPAAEDRVKVRLQIRAKQVFQPLISNARVPQSGINALRTKFKTIQGE